MKVSILNVQHKDGSSFSVMEKMLKILKIPEYRNYTVLIINADIKKKKVQGKNFSFLLNKHFKLLFSTGLLPIGLIRVLLYKSTSHSTLLSHLSFPLLLLKQ